MVERSIRVVLSSDVTQYVAAVEKAAGATRNIAVAAAEVRTKLGTITVTADELNTRLKTLGNNTGLGKLATELTKVKVATEGLAKSDTIVTSLAVSLLDLTGVAGLTATAAEIRKVSAAAIGLAEAGKAADSIVALASGLIDLSRSGTGLTEVAAVVRKISAAVAGLASTTAEAPAIIALAGALRDIGTVGSFVAAAGLGDLSVAIRRLIKDSASVPGLRMLTTTIRELGMAGAGLGGGFAGFGEMQSQIRLLIAQVDRLRAAAGAPVRIAAAGATPATARTGASSSNASGGNFGILNSVKYMAAASAMYAVLGVVKSTVTATAGFEQSINTLGAVASDASVKAAGGLAAVSAKAEALGADFTIANASAADAAETMTELVKGGLSVQQAMDAARGSLQLAAAGGLTFVQAADIETAAIAQFGLKATDASTIADQLANSAHVARGSVETMGTALSYVGPIAHQAGWSLSQTSNVLAEFAKFGITGSMAGTEVRGMLTRLEVASVHTGTAAGKAYQQLGLDVRNADGSIKDAGAIADQLAAAHKKLKPAVYDAAIATLFGQRAQAGANILMAQGSKGLGDIDAKTKSLGGAAGFSAAQMKGLSGTLANVKNQASSAEIVIGEKLSPALQAVGNGLATAIKGTAAFLTGSAFAKGASTVGDIFGPILKSAGDLITTAWPYVSKFLGSLKDGFTAVLGFLKPIGEGIGTFVKSFTSGGGLTQIGTVLDAIGRGFSGILNFVKPLGSVLGTAIGWLGKIPGPVWLGVTALTAFLLLKGPMVTFLTGIDGLGQGIARAFSGGITSMIKGVGGSLLTAFGGPVGIAILAVTTALAFLPQILKLFASGNETAKKAVEDHATAVKDLTTSLLASKGVINDSTRATALSTLQNEKWGKSSTDLTTYADRLGVSQQNLVDGMLNVPGASTKIQAAYDTQVTALNKLIKAGTYWDSSTGSNQQFQNASARAAAANLVILNQQHDAYQPLIGSITDATDSYKKQQTAIKGAATYTDAKTVADKKAADAAANLAAQNKAIADSLVPITATDAITGLAGQYVEFDNALVTIVTDKNNASTAVTGMSTAFSAYQTQATEATAETTLFMYAIQKLGGKDMSAQQAIDAQAAAVRAIGASYRDQAAAIADVGTKQAALKAIQDKATGTAADGSVYTSAQKTADEAAATRDLAAANDAVATSAAGITDKQVALQQQTASLMATTVTKIDEAKGASGGYTNAVKAGTKIMDDARAAFILQNSTLGGTVVATDQSKAAAGRLADQLGLLPGSVQAVIDAVPHLAAEHDKLTAALAVKAEVKLKVDKADALLDIKTFGLNLANIPAIYKTSFVADIATAATNGEGLYQVYDKVKGTWSAQFLTPTAAQAQTDAGITLRKYDKLTGTWTADIVGKDKASAVIATVAQAIAALKDKTVVLTLTQAGAAAGLIIDSNNAHAAAKGKATGGAIRGPGTGTSDSIPAWLSNGEFVNTAASTKKNRKALEYANSGGVIPGFAAGGKVGGVNVDINATDPSKLVAGINELIPSTIAAAVKAFGELSGDINGPGLGAGAARAAITQLGVPYVWGAEQANVAFDCSGLTRWAWGQEGVSLPHYSGGQAVGQKVTQAQLTPGDLTVWDGHVNMYIGNGQIIEAPQPGENVRERPVYTENQGDPFLGFWRPSPLLSLPAGSQRDNTSGLIAQPPGAGVERWAPLMTTALNLIGQFSPANLAAGLNQMRTESSGNPSAINNTDSNAQRGTPSEGLMQVIQPTFDSYAYPGFSSNIWDPESNILASARYTMSRYGSLLNGWRGVAYAGGGPVTGPGTGTSDQIPAMLSHGEFVNTAASTSRNRSALEYANGGGTIPGFASGGLAASLPTLKALAGNPVAVWTPGKAAQAVIDALQKITDAIANAFTQAAAKADVTTTKLNTLNSAKNRESAHVAAAQGRIDVLTKAASGTVQNAATAGNAQLAASVTSTNAAVEAARRRVEVANTTGSYKTRVSRAAAAEASLAAAEAKQGTTLAAVNARIAASEASKNKTATTSLALAQLQLIKTKAIDGIATAKAQREYDAALKTSTAYAAAAKSATAFEAAQTKANALQKSYGNQVDVLTTHLGTATASLAQMRTDRASMLNSVSGTVSGFDSGILGHPDTRTSYAAIMTGQKYDIAQANKFNTEISTLAKKGLNTTSLQAIAGAGIDGGGVTAAALAAATPGQIKALNAAETQLRKVGNNVGNVVAGSAYDAGIKVGQGLVNGLTSQISAIQKAMIQIATAAVDALTKRLAIKSPSQVMHVLGQHTAQGFANGIAARGGDVAAAMTGLVQVPSIPAQTYAASNAGNLTAGSPLGGCQVTVYLGDREITDIVRVEMNGQTQELTAKFRARRHQS